MAVTITIDDDDGHNIFDDLICEEDTTITGAVDIYVRKNFDVDAAITLVTSNGNLYIQNDCIESFNPSGGIVTLGTGDLVFHHTLLGATSYDFAFSGVINCDNLWFRKANDSSTNGCDITLTATLNPIIAAGGAIIIENRKPEYVFRVIQNGQTIEQGLN